MHVPNVTLQGHAVIGKFTLGMDVVNKLRAKKDEVARKNEEKVRKVHGEYDALLEQVQQIRETNTQTHHWNVK